jgi:hypothetical protein
LRRSCTRGLPRHGPVLCQRPRLLVGQHDGPGLPRARSARAVGPALIAERSRCPWHRGGHPQRGPAARGVAALVMIGMTLPGVLGSRGSAERVAATRGHRRPAPGRRRVPLLSQHSVDRAQPPRLRSGRCQPTDTRRDKLVIEAGAVPAARWCRRSQRGRKPRVRLVRGVWRCAACRWRRHRQRTAVDGRALGP